MIDKEVIRGNKVQDGKVWAFIEERFKNGEGNNVIRTVEEEVTEEFVDKTLSELIQKKVTEIDENYAQTRKDITKTNKRLKELINKRSYIEFKKYIDSKEYKRLYSIYQMEQNKIDTSELLDATSLNKVYSDFKDMIATPEFKQNFITHKDEENLVQLNKQKENLERMRLEIKDWRKQFLDIKKVFENGKKD